MRSLVQLLVLLTCAPSAIAEHADLDVDHEVGFHGPHHLSALLADTHVQSEGNNFTIGIDYEYRVNQLLGVGGVLEKAYGEIDAITALVVADIHFDSGLIMQVGPGFERRHHENIFVSRFGVLYEFEQSNFTLSPQLHWDYHAHEHNAIVAGIALGFAF